jgi:antitoxin VapB
MALSIENPEAVRLARELADETRESIARAVTTALWERLDAVRRARCSGRVHTDVGEIQAAIAALADRDSRSPDEILDFDDRGLHG